MYSTEQLAALIDRKRRVLLQLREVGRRQLEYVASYDTASLLTQLAAKQGLISALQSVECELAPYYGEDAEKRVWPSPELRRRCAGQAADCNSLLEEIVRLEKLGVDQLTVHRNHLAEQLQQIHAAAEVRSAYQAQRR
jgi:hypothetical protein